MGGRVDRQTHRSRDLRDALRRAGFHSNSPNPLGAEGVFFPSLFAECEPLANELCK